MAGVLLVATIRLSHIFFSGREKVKHESNDRSPTDSLYGSWGELKLTFSIMALLKRLISTVSMLQKALIRLTPMLFSIFLQKSQSLALLIFDFFFLQFGFAMRRLGEKTVGLGRLTERL